MSRITLVFGLFETRPGCDVLGASGATNSVPIRKLRHAMASAFSRCKDPTDWPGSKDNIVMHQLHIRDRATTS